MPTGPPIWRLRFRENGRLRTITVGRDPEFLAQVRQELAELQTPRRRRLDRRRFLRGEKQKLRDYKHRAANLIRSLGFHFHGTTMRRRRKLMVKESNS